VQNRDEFQFISILSAATYKGFDLILKTASLLKLQGLKFRWTICGASANAPVIRAMEKIFKKRYDRLNVYFAGEKSSKELVSLLLDADLFIHPSYIDNSPNSICEAQLLGLPVVATYTGGVSSLIENNKTGMLVPVNDPYFLSGIIASLLSNPDKMQYLGANAGELARKRHDKENILKNIEDIYQEIWDNI
jgi:glycosyltransferase involved in cell wall biosynthesis